MATVTRDIATELYNYVISDPDFVPAVKENFVITGEVQQTDLCGNRVPGTKTYAFVGHGCGITYLEYKGQSKKANAFMDLAWGVVSNIERYLYEQFTQVEKDYFESIGSPIQAVLSQDRQVQIEIYKRLVRYAHDILGLENMSYRSVLD